MVFFSMVRHTNCAVLTHADTVSEAGPSEHKPCRRGMASVARHREQTASQAAEQTPDVKVADLMKEFDLQTRDEHIDEADKVQRARR